MQGVPTGGLSTGQHATAGGRDRSGPCTLPRMRRRMLALTCLQPHQARACAQAVWVASLAVAVPVVARAPWMAIPSAHVEILAGAAAVGSVCAELFMIKSLLVFEPKASTVPSGTLGVLSGDRAGNVAMSGPRMNPTMAVGECQVNCDTLVS